MVPVIVPLTLYLIPLVIILLLPTTLAADPGFSLTSSTCLSTSQTSQFLDAAGLACTTCPTNSTPSADRLSCACNAGYYTAISSSLSTSSPLSTPTCTACTTGVPSTLGEYCVTCDTATGASTSADGNSCVCAAGSAISEVDALGVPIYDAVLNVYYARCVACSTANAVQSGTSCTACTYPKVLVAGTCKCPATLPTGSACSDAASDLAAAVGVLGVGNTSSAAYTIKYYDIEDSSGGKADTSVVSYELSTYLGSAAWNCWNNGSTFKEVTNGAQACNRLANYCVLTDYDYVSSTPCMLLARIQSLRKSTKYHSTSYPFNWALHTPWIAYDEGEVTTALTDKSLSVQGTFGSTTYPPTQKATGSANSTFIFKLATYNLDGTFYALEDLSDQLQICGPVGQQGNSWANVGTDYNFTCTLDAAALLRRSTGANTTTTVVNGTTTTTSTTTSNILFYELYLEDGTGRLYPVPVLNKSQRINANLVNKDAKYSTTSARLTRRFYLVDAVSSNAAISLDGDPTRNLQAIRYASSVEVVMQIDESSMPRKFLAPVLVIEYAANKPVATNSLTSSFTVSWIPSASLAAIYLALMITAFVVGGVLGIFRVYTSSLRSGASAPTLPSVLNAIGTVATFTAYGGFTLLLVWGLYWIFLFKLQSSLFTLIPQDTANVYITLYVSISLLSFGIVTMVVAQSQASVSFVDWERPKKISKPGATTETLAPVSCWRTLLVANEWSELATQRFARPEITIIIVLVCLEGLRWINASDVAPTSMSTVEYPWTVHSILLRMGLLLGLYMGALLAVYIIKFGVLDRFVSTPIHENFIDVCYTANVSLLVLDTPTAGYYLHGKSTIASADGSLKELQMHLAKESAATVGVRGLMSDAPTEKERNCQTFEVFLGRNIANKMDELVAYGNMANTRDNRFAGLPQTEMGIDSSDVQRQISYMIRRILVEMLSHTSLHQIVHRPFIRKILGFPPLPAESSVIFEYARSSAYLNVTFYGKDFTLAVWEALLFLSLDLAVGGNVALAAAITLIAVYVLAAIRNYLGKARISRTSFISEIFLI